MSKVKQGGSTAEKPPRYRTGRPTRYLRKYCRELVEYFYGHELYKEVEIPHYDKNGNISWIDKKRIAGELPTMEGFAQKIGISYKTLWEWKKRHGEFRNAYAHAQGIQKDMLIQGGLMGIYQANFAIFVAQNLTDLRDSKNFDVTSGGNRIIRQGYGLVGEGGSLIK